MNKNFLYNLVKLLRVKHWIKNIFVLLPLVFSNSYLNTTDLYKSFSAFIIFCLAASAVYIVNDIVDKKNDMKHPVKKFRPIASGSIDISIAVKILIFLYLVIIFLSLSNLNIMLVVLIYILLNIMYSYFLKNYAVIDIFVISFGFLLRVYAGIFAINCDISNWALITTFCLALFLASVKRKQELKNIRTISRQSLNNYSLNLIDFYINISGILAIVFYSLFSLTINENFFITIPIVIISFFRYLYMQEIKNKGESPTDAIFEDNFFMAMLLIWFIISILILTFN